MPAFAGDVFGETAVIRWSNGAVLQSLNGGAEQTVLALAQESGLAIAELPDGRWVIVAQDTACGVRRAYSVDGVNYV